MVRFRLDVGQLMQKNERATIAIQMALEEFCAGTVTHYSTLDLLVAIRMFRNFLTNSQGIDFPDLHRLEGAIDMLMSPPKTAAPKGAN